MIPFYIVDAFTLANNEPFTGNSAAICLLQYDDDISDDIKQKIAAEMNLSETAFVTKGWKKHENIGKGSIHTYTIRWFTPVAEVKLCGHATLAAARVMFERMKLSNDKILNLNESNEILFESKFRGSLGTVMNWKNDLIALNFPNDPPKIINNKEYPWIDDIANATLGPNIGLEEIRDISYSTIAKYLMIRIKDSNRIKITMVEPNFTKLKQINTNGLVSGVIFTEKANFSNENIHFYSRFFCPWFGVNEDPVCGSAHTLLAPYWREEYDNNGMFKCEELIGKQCYPSRGGFVYTLVCGDRVKLSGRSKIIVNGELKI